MGKFSWGSQHRRKKWMAEWRCLGLAFSLQMPAYFPCFWFLTHHFQCQLSWLMATGDAAVSCSSLKLCSSSCSPAFITPKLCFSIFKQWQWSYTCSPVFLILISGKGFLVKMDYMERSNIFLDPVLYKFWGGWWTQQLKFKGTPHLCKCPTKRRIGITHYTWHQVPCYWVVKSCM